ncbi:MAG TPA: hypothetical protein VH139_06735, partial [Acidobacteriaceae bacterium]|nr:hypothetical protein [Acidobacteriaceae bacterium]
MRQLGARLPVAPPAETDIVETPQSVPPARPADRPAAPVPLETEVPQTERYPVERHRIEPQRMESGPAATPPPPPAQPRQTEPANVGLEKNGAEVNRGAQAENDPWVKDTLAKLDAVNPVRQTANPAEQAANGAGYAVNPAEQANNAAASAAYPAGHVDDAAASVDSPAARWAEFHDFRQLEPGRGSRLNLQPMLQPQEDQLWVRPRVQREREHHFPFLTLAVPGFAATLAVGALLWSGSLRDRVHQQDAAMNALQEQNQKLADTLAQMNVDQKATSALNGSSDSTNTPAGDAAQKDAAQKDENGVPSLQQQSVPPATQQATASTAMEQPEPASPQSANLAGASVQRQSAREPGNRQGVSTPPPVGQSSRQQNGRYRAPVQTGYKPELVPPYPTTFQPQNV